MTPGTNRPAEFWDELQRTVARMVEDALADPQAKRSPLIAYLRQAEEMARTDCSCRQTVQIIASGRSLLGDRHAIGPQDGPFARA